MNRTSVVLVAVSGILAGALGYSLLNPPKPVTDEAAIRAIVEDVLASQTAAAPAADGPIEMAAIDPAVLNPMIEEFLMSDPKVLQRVSTALETALKAEERERGQAAIAQYQDAIFNDEDGIVIGNPNGDVTLVEFYDYNCGYCRAAVPDMAQLIADDPNLRIVLKEFPILSNESIDAARVAVLVSQTDADYWTFHQTLYSGRGQANKESALAAAAELGLPRVDLELRMSEDHVTQTIQKSFEIAQALGITGTPTYIVGNEIIRGAVGVDTLREVIADMRECGQAQCS